MKFLQSHDNKKKNSAFIISQNTCKKLEPVKKYSRSFDVSSKSFFLFLQHIIS